LPKRSEAQTAQENDSLIIPTQRNSCPIAPLNKIPATAITESGNSFNDDMTPYNNRNGAAWCSYFVTWVLRQSGYSVPPTENARELLEWFASEHKNKPHHFYVFTNPTYQSGGITYNNLLPGDIVVWETPDDHHGHAGVIVAVDPCAEIIKTVEGNVAGNTVKIYTYNYRTIKNRDSERFELYGFGRP
jgi:hypothetical protein